jgi:hypothetical protein
MFNLTLGGRRFAIPYCTLCGSAQAYRTDAAELGGADEIPVVRTTGLLSRSNKVMYDLRTMSVFDTFTGAAVSDRSRTGASCSRTPACCAPPGASGSRPIPTPRSSPRTVASDGTYPLDPLQGRDDDGPIFPIGPADERLGVQELVVGVIRADGTPVAFPADVGPRGVHRRRAGWRSPGVVLVDDGGGLRASPSPRPVQPLCVTRIVLVRMEPVPPCHRSLGALIGSCSAQAAWPVWRRNVSESHRSVRRAIETVAHLEPHDAGDVDRCAVVGRLGTDSARRHRLRPACGDLNERDDRVAQASTNVDRKSGEAPSVLVAPHTARSRAR